MLQSPYASRTGNPKFSVRARQVMREFSEPGSCEVSSSEHGTRKRCRSGPRYGDSDADDDAWLGEKGGEEATFSPAQHTAAKSAPSAAANMTEAPDETDTPVTDGRGTQPPDRKRARNRHSGPSQAVAGSPASSVRRWSSPNTLYTSGNVVARAMESPRALDSADRKHRISAGRTSRVVRSGSGSGSSSSSRTFGGGRGGVSGGRGGGAGGVVEVDGGDGDGGRWGSRGGAGEGLRGAVAVTPQDSNLSPPDPSLMRECLDEYLEVRLAFSLFNNIIVDPRLCWTILAHL